MTEKFSRSELYALALLSEKKSILITQIPDKNEYDEFSRTLAGMSAYKKLIQKDICFITEEDPILFEDGENVEITPSVELTEKGEMLIKTLDFSSL